MVVYKTLWFNRWARKHGLGDVALLEAVKEMKNGLFEAEFGGHLFKKRIARQGQGKRGGFRTLVATNKNNLWFFVYGFAKNERSNIDSDEEAALKKLAATLLTMSAAALVNALKADELIEVNYDA
ncbi:MAG: type II toxin-antitoxin system RelE/ParE family toxin [Gammaproteobacteria bacterium]|nr:type II toxin-antitoxin system RelE/ParE family toxin [Gammaproteobacteria bacterium]